MQHFITHLPHFNTSVVFKTCIHRQTGTRTDAGINNTYITQDRWVGKCYLHYVILPYSLTTFHHRNTIFSHTVTISWLCSVLEECITKVLPALDAMQYK